MTVTKAELANTLFEEVGLNKREAKEIVELFFEKITSVGPTPVHVVSCVL